MTLSPPFSAAPATPVRKVSVEGPFHRFAIQTFGNVEKRDRDRRGRRVEVGPFDAAGNEVERVRSARSLDRFEQRRGKAACDVTPARGGITIADCQALADTMPRLGVARWRERVAGILAATLALGAEVRR